ncbi:hypothetical protein LXL04_025039 [Taraxacum kok-saghyz]
MYTESLTYHLSNPFIIHVSHSVCLRGCLIARRTTDSDSDHGLGPESVRLIVDHGLGPRTRSDILPQTRSGDKNRRHIFLPLMSDSVRSPRCLVGAFDVGLGPDKLLAQRYLVLPSLIEVEGSSLIRDIVEVITPTMGGICRDLIPFTPSWCDGEKVSEDCWNACRNRYGSNFEATCFHETLFPGNGNIKQTEKDFQNQPVSEELHNGERSGGVLEYCIELDDVSTKNLSGPQHQEAISKSGNILLKGNLQKSPQTLALFTI